MTLKECRSVEEILYYLESQVIMSDIREWMEEFGESFRNAGVTFPPVGILGQYLFDNKDKTILLSDENDRFLKEVTANLLCFIQMAMFTSPKPKLLCDMTEPELREFFTSLARTIEHSLPPGPSNKGKCLFFLTVTDNSGIAQYTSNMNRQDAIRGLREAADRLESGNTVDRN